MLNVKDYQDSDSLACAIQENRASQETIYNKNPMVRLSIIELYNDERYVANVSWNYICQTWMCSVEFYGKSNQNKAYWTYEGCRSFTKLKYVCSTLLTMASAGVSRIHLTTSKWNKINKGEDPNVR